MKDYSKRTTMKKKHLLLRAFFLPLTLAVLFPGSGLSFEAHELDQCMQDALKTAADSVTVEGLRQGCIAKLEKKPVTREESDILRRQKLEKQVRDNPFVILPHKPNYILFGAYNSSRNEEPFKQQFPDENVKFENWESQFQISVKFPVIQDMFKDDLDLYFAYTNRSFWQVYAGDISSPFRETNHEPEFWVQHPNDWNILGLTNTHNKVGLVHQSNGRGGVLSRSWNRVFAQLFFERGDLAFAIKPWFIVGETDDNPDIEEFMGYFEFQGVYNWHRQTFGLLLRNNLRTSNNKGAAELTWSFPLYQKMRGYVQYFHGYGESLIDYNENNNTIGIGLQLTDWL